MENTFFVGQLYNVAQNIAPEALSNNHKPLYLFRASFVKSIEQNNGVCVHEFSHDVKEYFFDDDFVNNHRCGDNSLIIVLSKP
jgi:hypothetical protein